MLLSPVLCSAARVVLTGHRTTVAPSRHPHLAAQLLLRSIIASSVLAQLTVIRLFGNVSGLIIIFLRHCVSGSRNDTAKSSSVCDDDIAVLLLLQDELVQESGT